MANHSKNDVSEEFYAFLSCEDKVLIFQNRFNFLSSAFDLYENQLFDTADFRIMLSDDFMRLFYMRLFALHRDLMLFAKKVKR